MGRLGGTTATVRTRAGVTLAVVAVLSIVGAACSDTGGARVTGTTRDGATTAPSTTSAVASSGPTTTSPSSGATSSTIAVAPASWSTCSFDATLQCASVTVPLVYASPSAGTTTIQMARQPAAKPDERIGSLFLNPGGPGGSGIEFLQGFKTKLPKDLTDRFDLVGFDPRGVGRSGPISCLPDKDIVNGLDADPDTPAEEQALVDAQQEAASACTAKLGSKLSAYGTAAAARDLDRLRQAVGDDKLSYLGFSYGTLLGSVYATLFPDKVRALVLDGAVDPTDTESGATQAAGFQLAFSRFVAACAASTACAAAPDAQALYDTVKAAAEKSPIPVPGSTRALTPGYLLTGVAAAMYDQGSWPVLALGLKDAAAGDGTLLLALADNLNDRKADGTYGNLEDANRVISCDDEPRRPTEAEAKAKAAALAPTSPLLGPAAGWGELGCEGFPKADEPLPTVSAPSAPKMVVVGTLGDPATPFANTARLAKALGSAVTVSWNGDGHTATTKSACVTAAVSAYLTDLTVPQDGLACTDANTGTSKDPFVVDRTEIRTALIADLAKQVSQTRSACIVDGLLAKLDDAALLHFLYGGPSEAVTSMIRQVAAGCPG